MEWHVDLQFPLACAEARYKSRLYPPPMNNGYYTPWLWVDGHQRGSSYGQWATYINNAMAIPSEVALNVSGTYDPILRTGEVRAEFTNSSSSPIRASAYLVITEDSLYYVGPNGDPWHNHVCRDFVPDHYGTTITVPANGVDTFVQGFTLDMGWNERRCNAVVFLQDSTVSPDSSRTCYSGAVTPVMLLSGAAENPARRRELAVRAGPNPCRDRFELEFTVSRRGSYRMDLFGLDGRLIRQTSGAVEPGTRRIAWSLSDAEGTRVPAGIYLWRLSAPDGTGSGRIVATD